MLLKYSTTCYCVIAIDTDHFTENKVTLVYALLRDNKVQAENNHTDCVDSAQLRVGRSAQLMCRDRNDVRTAESFHIK